MSEKQDKQKKRIMRGRRPGVPLKEYEPRPDNPHARPNLRRFSVSVPSEMDRIIRSIRSQCDIEYAKIFRSGLDEFVRMNREKISSDTYHAYWLVRRQVDDSEWGKD
jgi:hypothetical protein